MRYRIRGRGLLHSRVEDGMHGTTKQLQIISINESLTQVQGWELGKKKPNTP